MAIVKEEMIARLLEARVVEVTPSGCHIWTGGLNGHGYGVARFDGRKNVRVHRLAWEAANGPIPDGMGLMHSCAVRCCVNPNHLTPATQADNLKDMSGSHSKISPISLHVQPLSHTNAAMLILKLTWWPNMYLKAHWNTALVTKEVRQMAEYQAERSLIGRFNGVDNAYIARQDFNRNGRAPTHHWAKAIDAAVQEATKDLSPSTRIGMSWKVGFFDD